MRFFKNASVRRKLTLVIMLTSSAAMMFACAAFITYDVFTFRREMVESVSSLAEVVGNNTTAAIDFNDPAAAAQTLWALRAEPNIVLAHVHTPDGLTFATYVREGTPIPPEVSHSLDTRHEFTTHHLHLFRPIMQAGEQVGTIELVATLDELPERLWRYAGIAALVLFASLLAALGLSRRFQKLISDPIMQLAQVVQVVAREKNYSVRATKQSADELGQLVDGFNEMLSQIQQRDAALQSASADLETRVEERTEDLAIANAALKVENEFRERSTNVLRESEEKFRQLAENITDVFYMTSPDMQQMQYVSPAYQQIWGRSVASVGTHPQEWVEAIVPEDRERVWQTFSRLTADEPNVSAEFRIARPDGSIRWIWSRGFQVRDTAGRVIRITGVASDITERKLSEAELEKMHKELVNASRQAGMADVATGVLHNVGNVLNSVNVASSCLADNLKKSKAANLFKVVVLLREHEADLGTFLTSDLKGRQIPGYLAQLAEHLAAEQTGALKELAGLQKNIEHIKDIVAMQQSFAKVSGVTEMLSVADLVEDALKMNATGLARHDIKVIREFQKVPLITVEKHKVLQILVNLVRNAKQACDEANPLEKQITLRLTPGNDGVRIAVSDNGIGIPAENLTGIFAHGFTTKKTGHGFGLHNSALAAREMGGSLSAQSDGPGSGATFTLELPQNPPTSDTTFQRRPKRELFGSTPVTATIKVEAS